MKKYLCALSISLLLGAVGGCATFGTTQTECTIYQDVGATADNSLIMKYIKDPCVAQRILATTAKAGAIWKPEYIDLFDAWAVKVEAIIESGVTYGDLQNLVIMKIAETNREAGLIILIVSEDIFIFDGNKEVISMIDKKLLLMSLEDLRAKVARLKILIG